jgi:predicted CXXCH cytochrome family protein
MRNRNRGTLRRVVAVATFAGALCFVGTAGADIVGTQHDFSGQPFSGGEICIVCHTPHFADTSVADAPLWNHEVTTETYSVYSSATLQSVPGQPGGISKLCLSCHDGTVALDSFGGATGTSFIGAASNVGTDLDDDHPISITYNTALATADGELHDPATTNSGLGGTIAADMLFSGLLECGSCHDVHGRGFNDFLLKSNAASALCLTCHDK